MKLLFADQTRELDSRAIHGLAIPSTLLMTNAAAHLAKEAAARLGNGYAAVLCGTGNNGGDGIAAAFMLLRDGFSVRCFLAGDHGKMTADALAMEQRLTEYGGTLEPFDPKMPAQAEYIADAAVIIDALFGTGLHTPVRGAASEAIACINRAHGFIISADIPSGIDADTGVILGAAVRADLTVTFSAAKPGLFIEHGAVHAGKLMVAPIGIPDALLSACDTPVSAFTDSDLLLPRRQGVSHKGNYGKVFVLAGSTGFTGAPCLAAEAACRSGAGLVYLGTPQDVYPIIAAKCTEVMPFPLPSSNGKLAVSAYDAIMERLSACDVGLLGPGLGRSDALDALIPRIIEASPVPLILDADALNALSGRQSVLLKAAFPCIITPHEVEFTRIGGKLSGDRIGDCLAYAAAYNCILVLKGHRTITAYPDGRAFINTSGNPGMACGGSGDVLPGVLAAFSGQFFPPEWAVYVHGAAGDLAAEALGEYSMLPSDMITALCQVLKTHTET